MDKRWGWLLLLVVLIVPVSCTTYDVTIIQSPKGITDDQGEARKLYNELNLPTVLVRAEGGLGSAVIFGDGTLALTAAHVVSHHIMMTDDNGYPKRDPNGKLMFGPLEIEKAAVIKNLEGGPFLADVTVIKIDEDLDLAILKLDRAYTYGKAKFASVEPYLYQKCWISGHPHGVTDTTITEGRVQALWDEGFVRYSALSTFGNSGGPVWMRVNGKFVVFSICQRVHVEGMSATTHMGLGVLPSKMLEFVREYN